MATKIARVPVREQDPALRATNFTEVCYGYNDDEARREASRCLNCPKPPCREACPVHIRIPDFIEAVADGDNAAAARIIAEDSSLPSVCGRVCPQESQCEGHCVLGRRGEPVSIGKLERYVGDFAPVQAMPSASTPAGASKKVAVVGSGPAGLACATDLAKMGYAVTVFEALHELGGVLVYGIPEFRLPKSVVRREIEAVKRLGVRFETDVVVGRTVTVEGLLKKQENSANPSKDSFQIFPQGKFENENKNNPFPREGAGDGDFSAAKGGVAAPQGGVAGPQDKFDAVFIASGAGLPKFMGIPGENLNGVFSANEFLTRTNLMKAYDPRYDTPIHVGRRVVVVGGGNVAMDAVRCAKRLGAEATIVYRRSEAELPARVEEVHHAQQEGIIFRMLTTPVEVLGDSNGWVTGIRCREMTLGEPDASGRRAPIEKPNSDFDIPCDTVIMALGTSPNPLVVGQTAGLAANHRGGLQADDVGATTRTGVFAGGDAVTGSATVILAMGAGRTAAKAIDKYLR